MQQKILFLLTVRRMLLLEVFFLSALLISSEKTTADRSCRRLPRNKGWFEEVWNTYTDQRFKKTFRVSKATFNFILGRIQHDCDDTDSTSPIASSSSSSSCSLQPASGIFSSKGSSSSDELSDSAALQTKEEGACKLARKAAMFVLNHSRPRPSAYVSDSWPSCAEELWGNKQNQCACSLKDIFPRSYSRDSQDNNSRENTFPKFMHLVRHGISTTFESLPCQSRVARQTLSNLIVLPH